MEEINVIKKYIYVFLYGMDVIFFFFFIFIFFQINTKKNSSIPRLYIISIHQGFLLDRRDRFQREEYATSSLASNDDMGPV
jgi:hypothetical protein